MRGDELRAADRQWIASAARFVLPLLAIIVAKLWLIHGEEIAGSATHYDALWFVKSAGAWYWGAEYSWIAFIRPPAYPLWLALSHAVGVPQRLAIELLQLSGFAALAVALRFVGFGRSICIAGFALAAFHPSGFQLNNYTMADPFYAGVLPFVLAGMLSLIVRPRAWTAAATGGALAVLWLTREESILVAALAAAFCAIWITRERAVCGRWIAALQRTGWAAMTMLVVLAALLFTVCTANNRTFLAFAKSDMSAPRFQRAMDALLRIKPREALRFAPVPTETFERAFSLSPAFARLAPELRGGIGEAWRIASLNHSKIRGDIATDLIPWAIRNAAEANGVHASAAKAKHFYSKVARELNDACDSGRVERRTVFGGAVGANLVSQWRHVPASFCRMMRLFAVPYEMAPVRDDEVLDSSDRAVYDRMTLRRPPESLPPRESDLASRMENFIARFYRCVIIALVAAGVAAVGILVLFRRGVQFADPAIAALLLLLFAIMSRIALLTAVDAASWPVAYDRFIYPVAPITSIVLVALIGHAWSVMRRGDYGQRTRQANASPSGVSA